MKTMAAPEKKSGKRKPKNAPDPEKPWSERFKELRDKLGLNQTQAAAKLGISQSQWSAFESGGRIPTRPIAHLFALLESGKI